MVFWCLRLRTLARLGLGESVCVGYGRLEDDCRALENDVVSASIGVVALDLGEVG